MSRLVGYINMIAINSAIVLKASTVVASIMRVAPVCNADRTKSQSRPRLHRTLLASAAVVSVAIMLGGVFAYRELSPLDSFLQVHAAPNSAVSVQSLRIPATTVRAA